MKRLLLLLLIGLMISCGNNKKKQKTELKKPQTEFKTFEKQEGPYKSAELNATFNDKLVAQVYKGYNAVKTNLVNSKADEVQKVASENAASLSGEKSVEKLVKTYKKLSSTKKLEKQRKIFSDLTEIVLKKVEDNVNSGKLYYQYCPMAFNGEGGYWISNGKEIHNPYFGSKMLKCGEVKSTIK